MLAVRKSPEASEYFFRFSEWINSPEQTNSIELATSLNRYVDRLRKDYVKTAEVRLNKLVFGTTDNDNSKDVFWRDTIFKSLGLGLPPPVNMIMFLFERTWCFLNMYAPDTASFLEESILGARTKQLSISLQSIHTTSNDIQIIDQEPELDVTITKSR